MTYSSKELRANCVDELLIVARQLRRKHNLTQGELAAMVGVDKTHLAKVESGKRPLCPKTRAKLEAWSARWAKYAELEL